MVPFAKLELLVVQGSERNRTSFSFFGSTSYFSSFLGQETYQFDPPADSSTKILNPLLIPLDWLIPEVGERDSYY